MAKDIAVKSCLGEDDYGIFKRYQRMLGTSEAQLIRRAWFFFEDNHWETLLRHEERRGSPMLGPKRAEAH